MFATNPKVMLEALGDHSKRVGSRAVRDGSCTLQGDILKAYTELVSKERQEGLGWILTNEHHVYKESIIY